MTALLMLLEAAGAAASAAAAPVAPAPQVREQVVEQVTQPEDRPLAQPTIGGPAGLFRLVTTDVGAAGTFRVGLHGEFFQANDFLVAGDDDARVSGTVAIGYTPWRYLELYTAFRGSSNRNTRMDASRNDPEVITALGDPAFGVKGRYPLGLLEVGADLGLKLVTSVSGLSPSGDATNFWATAIASLDGTRLARPLPARLHINLGYLADRSTKLIDFGNPPRPAQTRMAAAFGYGIGRSGVRVGAGIDAPLQMGRVGLQPLCEYHLAVATGEADTFYDPMVNPSLNLPKDKIDGRVAQFLTVGVRANPMRGLVVDLGTDIGLTSVGFEFGTPTPPWNLVFGAAYSYDPFSGRTLTVTRTVAGASPHEGRIRGYIHAGGVGGGRAVPNALVEITGVKAGRLASSDDGSFLSFPIVPGTVEIAVSAEGYEPTHTTATVVSGRDTSVDITLTPKPPSGRVHGKVVDEQGKPVEGAVVRFQGPAGRELPTSGGAFEASLPPGAYVARAVAPNYLTKEHTVELKQGTDEGIEFLLRPRPANARVELAKDRILTKGSIHFHIDKTEVEPDSRQLLDEVVDLLIAHPEIRRVRVEGHTDSTGTAAHNQQLSRDRAAAVVAYLSGQGIAPSRLDSEGFGSTRPLVPNMSRSNKEKNRRVEFRILETQTGAP